ncbi:hypothetical protein HF086_013373 [Spodoptera exigua]|uniref:Uncharacterized protein n=1 Tax=Spodoptera exigua TaxID=7107 RepID=A0A922MJ69_SPOEX|nr:hypothetical protein HF086_013373 [Spodoptera exigua]
MANYGRIMYPKEVAEARKKAISASKAEDKDSSAEDCNVVEEPAAQKRSYNLIQVPFNCSDSTEMGIDGTCRVVT